MELMEEVGKTVKREYCHEENDEELRKAVHDACYAKAYAIAESGNKNKHEREVPSTLSVMNSRHSLLKKSSKKKAR